MNRFKKVLSALMLTVAVVCAAGCTKTDDPNNGGNNNGGNGGGSPNTGALPGKFTINDNREMIHFSQGNLQYQASTHTWRFADNQYDYMASNNANISETNSGWIDLFGWGTGNNPTNSSVDDSDYSTFVDWGVSNAITNGGNQAGVWRTLTIDEWEYVLYTRNTASGICFVKAEVAGVKGIILLPDDWNRANYVLYETNVGTAHYDTNVVSQNDWESIFEANGAVFLPAAGRRDGGSVSGAGGIGFYWSSSLLETHPCYVNFSDYVLYSFLTLSPYFGLSVRLVCPAE